MENQKSYPNELPDSILMKSNNGTVAETVGNNVAFLAAGG